MWDHRALEGALYGLGRPLDASPAATHYDPVYRPARTGPSPLPQPLARRIDVGMAVQRTDLSPDERRVLMEHYVTGARRHPYRRRKPIIGALLVALNATLDDSGAG